MGRKRKREDLPYLIREHDFCLAEEKELLLKNYHFYRSLETGRRKPNTYKQRHFARMCNGDVKPWAGLKGLHKRAYWSYMKYRSHIKYCDGLEETKRLQDQDQDLADVQSYEFLPDKIVVSKLLKDENWLRSADLKLLESFRDQLLKKPRLSLKQRKTLENIRENVDSRKGPQFFSGGRPGSKR